MAFEIIKTYKEHYPALRFIGKRYTDEDRGDPGGGFGNKWSEWHQNGWFGLLEKLAVPAEQNGNAYVGLMTIDSLNHSGFTYWIGIFLPEGTLVPEEFSYLDLPESDVGINWIYGSDKSGEIFGSGPHSAAYEKLCENGWSRLNQNADGVHTLVFFELYNCPRYTTPDDKGNVILDYGFYLD
ncbi:MAG: hypothetical protein PHV88_06100 [Eubacteriales bacterium]|jgi:hypothetical protein|nr:hypothetical protein [Eubacteriales bacterium]NCU26065.1 AraC family transcriptional regulator [Candidatus Nomurabacteria bacterium]